MVYRLGKPYWEVALSPLSPANMHFVYIGKLQEPTQELSGTNIRHARFTDKPLFVSSSPAGKPRKIS